MELDEQAAPRSRNLPVAVSAGVVLVPMVVAKTAELVLKSANPSNVNVSSDLAYLRPLLILGWAMFAVYLVVAVVVNIRGAKHAGPGTTRAAWIVLAVQLVLGLLYVAVQLGVNGVTAE